MAGSPELLAQADPAITGAITPTTASLASHPSTKSGLFTLVYVVSTSIAAMTVTGLSATPTASGSDALTV